MSTDDLRIRTPRLDLRPLTADVAAAITGGARGQDWAEGFPQEGDRTVAARVLAEAEHAPPGAALEWWGPWVVRSGEGLLIGTAGFHAAPVDGEVEVGYGIVAGQRGRGLASEAVAGLLDWARDAGAVRAIAHVLPGNEASIRLLSRLGFARTGSAPTEHGEGEWGRDLDEPPSR